MLGQGVTQDDRDTAKSLVDAELKKLDNVQLDPSEINLWVSVRGPPNSGTKVFLANRVQYNFFYACAFDSSMTALVHGIINEGLVDSLAEAFNGSGNEEGASFGHILRLFLEEQWADLRFLWARDFVPGLYFVPEDKVDMVRCVGFRSAFTLNDHHALPCFPRFSKMDEDALPEHTLNVCTSM